MNKRTAKIVVIGGGLAGLTAVDELVNRHGFKDVTLVEAGARLGGRVRWEETADGSLLHYGAQYLHNHTNRLYTAMDEAGLVDHDPVDKDHDRIFIGRDAPAIPDHFLEQLWTYSLVNRAEMQELRGKYPREGDSVGRLLERFFAENFAQLPRAQFAGYKTALANSLRQMVEAWIACAHWSGVAMTKT